jgi:hypothetical protein
MYRASACFDPNGHGSRQGRSADFMAGTAGALDGSDLIVSTTHDHESCDRSSHQMARELPTRSH